MNRIKLISDNKDPTIVYVVDEKTGKRIDGILKAEVILEPNELPIAKLTVHPLIHLICDTDDTIT